MQTAAAASVESFTHARRRERRQPQPLLSRYTIFGGRRRVARRDEDRTGYIADFHGTTMFLAVIAIAALNILDAFYTVLFLSHGGTELNPFVDLVLHHAGVWAFVLIKSVGIGLCVGFLTLTKNYRASRIGLGIVLVGYVLLLCWHLHLFDYLPE
jgi:hypothetical protein